MSLKQQVITASSGKPVYESNPAKKHSEADWIDSSISWADAVCAGGHGLNPLPNDPSSMVGSDFYVHS